MKVVQFVQTALSDERMRAVQCDIHREWIGFSVHSLLSIKLPDIMALAQEEVKKCPKCIEEFEAAKPKFLMWPEGAEL